MSVPQPGGERRLQDFKDGNEVWRFFLAVQAQLHPNPLQETALAASLHNAEGLG